MIVCLLYLLSVVFNGNVNSFSSSLQFRKQYDHPRLLFTGPAAAQRRWLRLDELKATKSAKGAVVSATSRSVAIQALVRSTPIKSAVDVMENLSEFKTLGIRDKAFCRLLVSTVERRKGQINGILDYCSKKKNKSPGNKKRKLDQLMDATLQVGLVQLLFLNTTPFAAVKETVDTLRLPLISNIAITDQQIGYVNAILRRLGREGDALLNQFSSTRLNVAPWLLEEMENDWGVETTNNILEHAMTESPRTLTVRCHWNDRKNNKDGDNKTVQNIAAWFEDAIVLPQGSIRILQPPPGAISAWPLYSEGRWWCQDPAATLPALALYHSRNHHKPCTTEEPRDHQNPHVIDMCAAPGGKTAQLLDMGFHVTAVDISEKRIHTLRQNLARLHLLSDQNCEVVVANGIEWKPKQKAQYVLLDAPCSATGTASKHPDVLWKDESMLDGLLSTQYALLQHAVDHLLVPNGILVYATCSLIKRESEDQVARLLQERSQDVELVPFQPDEIPGVTDKQISVEGYIRNIPAPLLDPRSPQLGGDGFFVARLRKR